MTQSRLLLTLLAVAALSVAATVLTQEIFRDEPPVEGALSVSLRSTVLGEDREYFVHLPEGYAAEATRRFPVMYVLDGPAQSGHTAASAALLARVGLVPPMIVVGVPSVDGDSRNLDYTPPDMRLDTDDAASRNGAADRFLLHLKTELIPAIERQYRSAHPRLLAGWSRGGLFVVYSQIAEPALFDARFAHSPALWREHDRIVGQLEKTFSGRATPEGFLFLSLGSAENEKMRAAYDRTIAMMTRRAPASLRWRAYSSPAGTHESNPRLATPVGLCAMFNPDRPCATLRPAVSAAPN